MGWRWSGGTEGRESAAEAADDAVASEHHHGIEERGRDSLANDGYARGVNEQAGLHRFGFSEGAQGVVASVMAPVRRRNGGERCCELDEQLRHFGILPEFGFRGRVDLELVGEKR